MTRDKNVGVGVFGGLVAAAGYSAIAVIIYVASGGSAFREAGIPLGATVLLYFAGGIIGGIVVGFLWPWTRSALGAAVVGVLGAFPLCLGAAVLLENPLATRDYTPVWAAGILAVILGSWIGLFFLRD